ncbi:efflux RND transporter periplasmic adaptor subunit [Sphingomonas sp. AR_OL41]|uniref:HlyD family secretion protein n=1 Tax=Sphingomonas sp. AR_OL41 TaxID=3042729 RepID=UPI0024812A2F|nr:HlyD family efflux transporter periplasmic adaptor subunit [Sphingomonas sp. AR_OL41]MDH7975925.1 efflux RND transporter periplasmic adaptor subunit [Sphingomonas sp. AR_OL41]
MRSLALLLLLGACSAASQSLPDRDAQFVATSIGRTDSAAEARALVAETDGAIESVAVKVGDPVRAGQLLLTVGCGPQAATVAVRDAGRVQAEAAADKVVHGARAEDRAAAVAQVRVATALLEDARDRSQRARALVARGFVSGRTIAGLDNEVQGAEAGLAAARAAFDALRNGSREEDTREARAAGASATAEVAVARAIRDRCDLRSPIDGTVLQILRRAGEFSGASQGAPLIIVGDLSHLIVRAEVTDRNAAQVRVGQRAVVWIDGQQQRWQGRVERLAAVMGRRTARSLDPTDRFDRDVREVIVALPGGGPPRLVGLRVNVGFTR